jgi:hypothetical protein
MLDFGTDQHSFGLTPPPQGLTVRVPRTDRETVLEHHRSRWWNPSLEDQSNDRADTLLGCVLQRKVSLLQRKMSPS